MKQGNITLPVLYALREEHLREPLLKEISRVHHEEGRASASDAIGMIRQSQGIAKAEALADRYMKKALDALDQLPNIKTTKNLRDIAHFVVKRTH